MHSLKGKTAKNDQCISLLFRKDVQEHRDMFARDASIVPTSSKSTFVVADVCTFDVMRSKSINR